MFFRTSCRGFRYQKRKTFRYANVIKSLTNKNASFFKWLDFNLFPGVSLTFSLSFFFFTACLEEIKLSVHHAHRISLELTQINQTFEPIQDNVCYSSFLRTCSQQVQQVRLLLLPLRTFEHFHFP